MKYIIYVLIFLFSIWIGISWFMFEWRNPLCNETAFYKHFPSVVTLKKLEQYQVIKRGER